MKTGIAALVITLGIAPECTAQDARPDPYFPTSPPAIDRMDKALDELAHAHIWTIMIQACELAGYLPKGQADYAVNLSFEMQEAVRQRYPQADYTKVREWAELEVKRYPLLTLSPPYGCSFLPERLVMSYHWMFHKAPNVRLIDVLPRE
jgi:hypothetical protein